MKRSALAVLALAGLAAVAVGAWKGPAAAGSKSADTKPGVYKVSAEKAVSEKADTAPAAGKSAPYKAPPEMSEFKLGPNLDVVKNNCTACHSADYVQVQPRGPKFKEDFWKATVIKMVKVYGAPIEDDDVPKIVDYLTKTY